MSNKQEKFEAVVTLMMRVSALRMWEGMEKSVANSDPSARPTCLRVLTEIDEEKERLNPLVDYALTDYVNCLKLEDTTGEAA